MESNFLNLFIHLFNQITIIRCLQLSNTVQGTSYIGMKTESPGVLSNRSNKDEIITTQCIKSYDTVNIRVLGKTPQCEALKNSQELGENVIYCKWIAYAKAYERRHGMFEDLEVSQHGRSICCEVRKNAKLRLERQTGDL